MTITGNAIAKLSPGGMSYSNNFILDSWYNPLPCASSSVSLLYIMTLTQTELFQGLKLNRLRALDIAYLKMHILKTDRDIPQLPVWELFKNWQKQREDDWQ